jgi:hypothetical protein
MEREERMVYRTGKRIQSTTTCVRESEGEVRER